jgi:hypothetical protein
MRQKRAKLGLRFKINPKRTAFAHKPRNNACRGYDVGRPLRSHGLSGNWVKENPFAQSRDNRGLCFFGKRWLSLLEAPPLKRLKKIVSLTILIAIRHNRSLQKSTCAV